MSAWADAPRGWRASACLAATLLLCACGANPGGDISSTPPPELRPLMALAGPGMVDAQLVTQANGVGYAVWVQPASDAGPSGVFTSRLKQGAWQAPQQVHVLARGRAGESVASDPRLAVHPDGEATMVWLQALPDGTRRVFHSHTVDGIWRTGEAVLHARGDVDARNVQIAADGSGRAMAVWSEAWDADHVARSVWVSHFDGEGFGAPKRLNVGDAPADVPRISLTGTGGALVVWNRDEGHHRAMAASSYWEGQWTPSQMVDGDTARDMFGWLWDLMVARYS
jgi:hypothetical protein